MAKIFTPRPDPRLARANDEPRVRINEDIRVPQIRVVTDDGAQLGVMSPAEALRIAQEREMDLVEIAPQAQPPVCKIIDYGKFRYEQQKREKAQKKTQHQQQLKEVRFKARTDTHDYDFKTRHAREFLLEGDKVKASIFFRGREMQHKEIGLVILEKFVKDLEDVGRIDQPIKMEGNIAMVILSPDKSKADKKKKEAAAEAAISSAE